MRAKLTPKYIEHLPPATGKRYEVRDTIVVGLVLRVAATGSKVWYLTARVDGQARRIKIGTHPVLSLADAREKARDTLREIQLGTFEQEPADNPTLTFGEVVPTFIELYAMPRTSDWRRTEASLRKFASLNSTRMADIKRSDIVRALDRIVAAGAPVRANRALAAVKKMYSWALDRGILEINPLVRLQPPTKEVPRDRVQRPQERSTPLPMPFNINGARLRCPVAVQIDLGSVAEL